MLKTKRHHLAAMALPFLAAACGETGGGIGGRVDLAAQMGEQGAALEESFALYQRTRIDDTPTTGSASFSGFAAYVEGGADLITDMEYTAADVVSDVTLTADFAANTVGGSLTNFQSNNDAYAGVDGQMVFSNGVIRRDAVDGYTTFDANVDGELSTNTTQSTADGVMVGQFISNDVRAASGAMSLELINSQNEWTTVSGVFVAERD